MSLIPRAPTATGEAVRQDSKLGQCGCPQNRYRQYGRKR